MISHSEHLEVKFTDAEKLEMGRDVARLNQEKRRLDQKLTEIKKQLTGEISGKETEIDRLMDLLSNGYEYRQVECRIDLDTPKQGQASIIRLDTEEVVRVRRMTDDEMQIELPLEAAPPEPEPPVAEEPAPVVDAEVLPVPGVLRRYSHEHQGGRFEVTVFRDEAGDIRWRGEGCIPEADGVDWTPDKTYVSEVAAAKDAMIAVWQWAYGVNGQTSKPITKAASLGLSVHASEVVSQLRVEAGE